MNDKPKDNNDSNLSILDNTNNIDNIDDLRSIQNSIIELNNKQEKTIHQYSKVNLPISVKLSKVLLSRNLCLCLIFVYKHYRYTDGVSITDYFQKKVLLQYLNNFPQIIKYFNHLVYWDLISPMPTSATEVKYKKGWYGITDNGIKFIQKEIGLPKYAFVYKNNVYEHQTNPYYLITDLIDYEELDELLIP